jgi:hypothetical protein
MTRNPFHPLLLSTVAIASVVSWHVAVGTAQTLGQPEHFTANYVDMNTSQTGPVEMDVQRWSTNAERDALVQTLFKEGSDALLEKLRDMRSVGRIYTPGSIGYDLKYASQRRLPDGGREIVLATDRPMSFWELRNSPRSTMYPFTWVQFQMKPDGTGEGKLAVAARIVGEEADRLIEVEDFALYPVRLQNIKSRVDTN